MRRIKYLAPPRFAAPRLAAAGLAALAVAGCASNGGIAETNEFITIAETNIRQAEQAGAAEHSALALDRARQKVEEARALLEDEPERALMVAEEAAVDAEVAASLARTGQAEEAVATIREDIRALRAEANL